MIGVLSLAVAGCSHAGDVSCTVFSPPATEVEATTPTAQRWVDITIERGVRICKWPRPERVK